MAKQQNPPQSSSIDRAENSSPWEATAGPPDNSLDALPPVPSGDVPQPPPATLAFPETQFGGVGEGPLPIPGYEIISELGRGGMGVVYKARQIRLGRLVALKMSRGGDMTGEDLARFRAEAEAVARLRHPNIVQIYEIGECQGRPFFCIEYVEGGSLADHLRGAPQPPRASAELVETLARAMHVAHEQGIIHRDLKPANVLLSAASEFTRDASAATLVDAPTRSAQTGPKIADFGIAKRLDKQSLHTATGAVLGTPNYMAPEQAWGSNKRRPVGPLADVYALGAILYEMLTGRPPFVGETPLDTLQQVVMQEPVPPTRLQPKVPTDLETICLKCLQKEPTRRYADAEALAQDLRRFLEDLPIHAKAEGPMTRLLRWRRRNPAIAALLAVVLLVLVAGAAVSTYFAFEARFAADQAVANADEAKRNEDKAELMARQAQDNEETAKANLKQAEENQRKAEESARELDKLLRVVYGWYVSLANTGYLEKNVGQMINALDSLVPDKAGAPDLRGFEWYYMRRRAGGRPLILEKAHPSAVQTLAFSPEGGLFATANAKKNEKGQGVETEISLWQAQSGKRLSSFKGHADSINCVGFSPDGKLVASASDDGTIMVWNPAESKNPVLICRGHEKEVTSVTFGVDGQFLISCSADKSVRFWDVKTGESTGIWPNLHDAVEWLAIHPAGESIALACRDGTVLWKDLSRGRELNRLEGRGRRVVHVAWNAKGTQLALAGNDGKVQLWDVGTNGSVVTVHNPTGSVHQVAFSPDGNHLASACDDTKVRLLGSGNVTQWKAFAEHNTQVRCLGFAADGALLASGGADGTIIIRPFGIKPPSLVLKGHSAGVHDVAWSSDGAVLASSRGINAAEERPADGSEIIVWNPVTLQPQHVLTGHAMRAFRVAFQPRGVLLASASQDGSIRLWDTESGNEIKVLSKQDRPYYALAWSHDGRHLAAAGDFAEAGRAMTRMTIWDVVTGNQVQTFLSPQDWMESLAWSRDGQWLAGGSTLFDEVFLWNARTRELVHRFHGHAAAINGLAFSADGRRLASAGADSSIRLWDVVEKKEVGVLTGHRGAVFGVAFHPDGKRLASAGEDNAVKLWDVETGKEVFTLSGHVAAVMSLQFRPDGNQLATASRDGTVRIWDATPLPEDARPSRKK